MQNSQWFLDYNLNYQCVTNEFIWNGFEYLHMKLLISEHSYSNCQYFSCEPKKLANRIGLIFGWIIPNVRQVEIFH